MKDQKEDTKKKEGAETPSKPRFYCLTCLGLISAVFGLPM
jgi:hypothetical protein